MRCMDRHKLISNLHIHFIFYVLAPQILWSIFSYHTHSKSYSSIHPLRTHTHTHRDRVKKAGLQPVCPVHKRQRAIQKLKPITEDCMEGRGSEGWHQLHPHPNSSGDLHIFRSKHTPHPNMCENRTLNWKKGGLCEWKTGNKCMECWWNSVPCSFYILFQEKGNKPQKPGRRFQITCAMMSGSDRVYTNIPEHSKAEWH